MTMVVGDGECIDTEEDPMSQGTILTAEGDVSTFAILIKGLHTDIHIAGVGHYGRV